MFSNKFPLIKTADNNTVEAILYMLDTMYNFKNLKNKFCILDRILLIYFKILRLIKIENL